MTQRFFVTGTDTGVGKTELSCALLSLMARRGLAPFAFKPMESGVARGALDADSMRLHQAAGGWQPRDTITLAQFVAPLAPGMAAKRERRAGHDRVWRRVLAVFSTFTGPGVVEGAGGLYVPLDTRHDVLDLAVALRLPTVVVARAGLGTINHTCLTLEALRAAKVSVAAVVLVQTAATRDPSVALNLAELRRRYRRVRFVGPVAFERSTRARARAFAVAAARILASR